MASTPVSTALLLGSGPVSGFPDLPGCAIMRTASLEEGLALLEETHFDILVLDDSLPAAENCPCLAFLKENHPEIPVAFLAGEPMPLNLGLAVRQGADAVLVPGDLAEPRQLYETLSFVAEKARRQARMAFELEDATADITMQRTAYLKLKDGQKMATAAMKAMSEVNHLLFSLEDENVYARDFCRVLVKKLGLKMAWVGLPHRGPDGLERILPAAHAGFEKNFLVRYRLKSWERHYSRSLLRKTLVEGDPVTIPDLEAPDVEFFRAEEALRRGYRSAAYFPLKKKNQSIGVLCLFSGERAAFGTAEMAYFSQMADELAHGIDLLRREEVHRRERSLLYLKNLAIESTPNGVVIYGPDRTIQYANPAMARMAGLDTASSLVGKPVCDLFCPDANLPARLDIREWQAPWAGETALLKTDGTAMPVMGCSAPVSDAKGNLVAVMATFLDKTKLDTRSTS